jgi:hypothetical protein
LELFRLRTENESKLIRDASIYVPWLEESLARYEHGRTAEWRDFARRLDARRMREGEARQRRHRRVFPEARRILEGTGWEGTDR